LASPLKNNSPFKITTNSTFADFSGPPSAIVEPVPTARERSLKALYDEDEKIQMLLNIIRNETNIQNNASRDLLLQMNCIVEDRYDNIIVYRIRTVYTRDPIIRF
jgi:hypothetical protein